MDFGFDEFIQFIFDMENEVISIEDFKSMVKDIREKKL